MISILCVALFACQPDKNITAGEAIKIVAEDLGERVNDAKGIHVHEGTYNEKPCYNVYFTLDGESMVYVISKEGELLHKGEGNHSH